MQDIANKKGMILKGFALISVADDSIIYPYIYPRHLQMTTDYKRHTLRKQGTKFTVNIQLRTVHTSKYKRKNMRKGFIVVF